MKTLINLNLGSKILLREAESNDAEFLKSLYEDPEIQFYALEEEDYLKIELESMYKTIQYFTDTENILFIVENDKKPIGIFMVYAFEGDKVKIGMVLETLSQSSNYATLIIRSMINYIFENYAVNKIVGEVFEVNYKAIGLMRKLEFIKEEVLKNKVRKNKRVMDMYIFSYPKPL